MSPALAVIFIVAAVNGQSMGGTRLVDDRFMSELPGVEVKGTESYYRKICNMCQFKSYDTYQKRNKIDDICQQCSLDKQEKKKTLSINGNDQRLRSLNEDAVRCKDLITLLQNEPVLRAAYRVNFEHRI